MKANIEGDRNPNAKLSKDDVLTIRHRYAAGTTQAELCRVYGVSHNTVARIVNRQTWNWLTDEGTGSPEWRDDQLPPLTPEQEREALAAAERLKAAMRGTSGS